MENVSSPTFCSTSNSTLVRFSWRAILYYIYTNKISFGRLGSQPPVPMEDGAFGKVGYREAEGFQMSPSPKSVYTLACTVRSLSRSSVVRTRLQPFGVDWFTAPSWSRFRGLQVEDRFDKHHSRASLPIFRKVGNSLPHVFCYFQINHPHSQARNDPNAAPPIVRDRPEILKQRRAVRSFPADLRWWSHPTPRRCHRVGL